MNVPGPAPRWSAGMCPAPMRSCSPSPPWVTWAAARPGDVLAYAGVLGESAAGLALLEAGLTEPAALIAAHRRPAPRYAAGPEAAALGATAMIDVSDGLLADAGHLARASGVQIDIAAVRLPVHPGLAAAAAALARASTAGRDDPAGRDAPVGDDPAGRDAAL